MREYSPSSTHHFESQPLVQEDNGQDLKTKQNKKRTVCGEKKVGITRASNNHERSGSEGVTKPF